MLGECLSGHGSRVNRGLSLWEGVLAKASAVRPRATTSLRKRTHTVPWTTSRHSVHSARCPAQPHVVSHECHQPTRSARTSTVTRERRHTLLRSVCSRHHPALVCPCPPHASSASVKSALDSGRFPHTIHTIHTLHTTHTYNTYIHTFRERTCATHSTKHDTRLFPHQSVSQLSLKRSVLTKEGRVSAPHSLCVPIDLLR